MEEPSGSVAERRAIAVAGVSGYDIRATALSGASLVDVEGDFVRCADSWGRGQLHPTNDVQATRDDAVKGLPDPRNTAQFSCLGWKRSGGGIAANARLVNE
jgi:hypothetical protein